MKRLRVTVVDLAAKGPTRALYARIMNANLAGIMPQVVACWCEEAGHDVRFICYTGAEDLQRELSGETDLVFVSAFTEAAHMAYAISAMMRQRGAVTAVGGPHARCFPEDSARHFDYVLGFTGRTEILEILKECSPWRPVGRQVAAKKQPAELPGVRERWKFIAPTIAKAPTIKMVPMIGSLGCPYTCSFCIDADVPYQPLSFDQIREDLKFLLTKMKKPLVGWHDPNFGIRFDDYMAAIEDAVPPGRMEFVAESSLSILSESHLKRLQQNGFGALLPGVESWFSLGGKSKTGARHGREKVQQVSDHINMIMRYVPYVQANFVLGLDCDEGPEPFELTKEFLEKTPGVFPGFSLLTAFGRATPLNRDFEREGRVLPFPFHFLNNNLAMNVRPKNYDWIEFYGYVADLTRNAFSPRRILRRFNANRRMIPKWMNVVRAVSSEGFGRAKYHETVRGLLQTDESVRRYFHGESTELPEFYRAQIRHDLGPFFHYLPEGRVDHAPLNWSDPPPIVAGASANRLVTVGAP